MSTVEVLGTRVDAIDLDATVERIEEWIEAGKREFVCFANVHVVETARRSPAVAEALAAAGLVLPDGAPVAWAASRVRGRPTERIAGSDVFDAVCRRLQGRRHFFLGSTPLVLAALEAAVRERYPGIVVAGSYSPPYGESVTPAGEVAAAVSAAAPDIVWVGLGAPKQELFMHRARGVLEAPVMLGVGAVFDFVSGTKPRAPVWAQRAGLEWAHRLAREPRRLGRRYIETNSRFALALARDLRKRR